MTIIERAKRYLATMPEAISGSGGHPATFKVAVALIHGFDLSEEEAWPLLLDYNARCLPPWTEKELRHKLASAGKVSRHPQPRGYLRGSTPAKPAKPAKPENPIGFRFTPWRELLAEVKGKQKPITTTPATPSEPLDAGVDIIEAAIRIFNGTLLPDDELDENLRTRLRLIEAVLNQRSADGGPGFMRSQIEACVIGLRGFAGEHPDIDVMLWRLAEAKKSAPTWQELVRKKTPSSPSFAPAARPEPRSTASSQARARRHARGR